MAQQMQDIQSEARSLDAQDALRIRKEEALKFIERDPDTQAYLQRSGLSYGTDDLGYLRDKYGAPTSTHVSQVIGNTSGAREAERAAEERIMRMWRRDRPISAVPALSDEAPAAQPTSMTDVAAPWRKVGEGEAGWRDETVQYGVNAPDGPSARRPQKAGPIAQPAAAQSSASQTGTRTAPPLSAFRQSTDRRDSGSPGTPLRQSTLLARVRAASKLPASTQRRILPGMLSSLADEASAVSARRSQEKKTRTSALAKLSSTARPTLFIFVILVVGLAGFFDVMDWADKFIVAIPVIGQLIHVAIVALKASTVIAARIQMELRVKAISEGAKNIYEHELELYNIAKTRQRRIAALASESGLKELLKGSNPDAGAASIGQFVRYQSSIIWNIILLALLESIPVIDMLPALTRSIVSVYRQQQVEYRKAQQLIAECNLLIDKLDRQYDIELRYLSVCVRLAQKLLIRASSMLQRIGEFVGFGPQPVRTPPPVRARGPSPGSVYDIGRPTPALGFAS